MSEAATKIDAAAQPAPSPLGVLDVLRVARGGLIVSHVWVYLLPALAGGPRLGWSFWAGLIYVTVPLGLLIYGWNDFFDWDVDHASPRKNHPVGGAAFGPSLKPAQLASLPRVIFLAQLPFALLWLAAGRLDLVGWLALMALGLAGVLLSVLVLRRLMTRLVRPLDELDQTLRQDLEWSRVFEILGPEELAVLTLTGDRQRDFEQYRSLSGELLLKLEVKEVDGNRIRELLVEVTRGESISAWVVSCFVGDFFSAGGGGRKTCSPCSSKSMPWKASSRFLRSHSSISRVLM